MNLSAKITTIILLTLMLLLFVFGWFSVRDADYVLEGLLDKHGNALTKVVSDFSVDLLLLEDYPVLETVLTSFAERENNVISIEVVHNENTVASFGKLTTEPGKLYVAPVEFRDPLTNVQTSFGEVRLRLSQVDNQKIIAARQKGIIVRTIVAFVVLLGIISLILRKTILQRIDALTQRIGAMSTAIGIHSDAVLAPGEGAAGKDELDILGSRFDEMAQRVLRHSEELHKEVASRTVDLQEAKEEAERSNIAKSRFLAAASHDLRQPLQAISLYTGVLEVKVRDPEVIPVVASIANGIQVVSDMLNTLLDVSRLDAGVVVPEVTQFAISDIFDELATEFQEQANNKGISFRVCRTTLRTRSDPVLLGRILRNLVSNAIHYTDHGKVLLGCRRYGAMFRVEVYDTGIGISADQIEEIFEDFHQVGNVARDRRLGLGLGLAIARGMADILGHRLSVTSLPGKGSCFFIELPLVTSIEDVNEQARPLQSAGSHKECILVIDDEQDVLDSIASLLDAYGYQVVAAQSKRQALDYLETLSRNPDIIIADYRLAEGETGNDAINEICQVRGTNIPGILLTGDTDPRRIASAASSGFSLLHKPIDHVELVAVIQEQLAYTRSA
jgi:signal transduction histidine kinase/ActR/RegA family two-component response regulator